MSKQSNSRMDQESKSVGKKNSKGLQQNTSTVLSKPKKKKINGNKKGKQFEREIANRLGHIFPEAERMLEYQASKVVGVDIEGTDRIRIQCKNHQGYCSVGTIHEIRTTNPNDIPVLVTKGNRLEAMAVLPFEKLVTLLEIAYGLELPFRTFDEQPRRVGMSPALAAPYRFHQDEIGDVYVIEETLDSLI